MRTKNVKFKKAVVIALLIISMFFGISVLAEDTALISFKKDYARIFSEIKRTGVSANPEVSSISMNAGNIIIEFSKPMDFSTLSNDTVIFKVALPGIGHGTVAGKVQHENAAALFISQSDLISGLGYTVTVTANAKDTDGNSLQSDHTQSFTLSDLKNSKIGQQLRDALDVQVALQDIPGAILFVSDSDKGEWVVASGNAVLDPETAMNPADRFRIGSITKTFTASAVLRLADEAMLALDDPVGQYLPELEIPKDDIITIRHLLNHTSGLADYVGYTLNILRYDPLHVFQPEELVRVGVEEAPDLLFEPGTAWSYSNTGYIILGLIIESVTGSSYAAEIRQHFIEPFGLANTFVPEPEDESVPGNHAHGYLDIEEYGELTDVTYTNPSCAWSAGNMISTAEDLACWARALYGGKVLSEASLAEMLDISDDYHYGLGVIYDDILGFGHTGGIAGYISLMLFNPDTNITFCVLINSFNISADMFSIVHEALNVLGRLNRKLTTDFQINNFTAFPGHRSINHTPSALTPCEINYLEICT